MQPQASPLERWFSERPGPFAHPLGTSSLGAWAWPELEACLGEPLPSAWPLGYAEVQGNLGLRAALAEAFGLPGPEAIFLTAGANEANELALRCLLPRLRRVLVAGPIYPQLSCLLEASSVELVRWEGLALEGPVDWGALLALVRPGVDLVVLNAPHNPTGADLEEAGWGALVEACRQAGAWLLADEVYRGLDAGDLAPMALRWGPERVVASGSFSKALALPGLRVGWLAGDPSLLREVLTLREHGSLGLAAPALGLAEWLWPRRQRLLARNQALLGELRQAALAFLAREAPAWRPIAPARAGLLMLQAPGGDDEASAEAWARTGEGLVVPGRRIGHPGWWRVGLGPREPAQLLAGLRALLRWAQAWPRPDGR